MRDPFGPLEGFADDARRALTAAEVEAERLGHDQIGTEHILLGLLTDEDAAVARHLRGAGASLAAARHKVDEAVGAPATRPTPGPLTTTKRATRAVEGAVRIADQRRSDAVSGSDLLLAVLNVEGRAGQVLRGLGVDIEGLRTGVDQSKELPAPPTSKSHEGVALRCPSCGGEIGNDLRHDVVISRADDGTTRDALVFSCRTCGAVLGVR